MNESILGILESILWKFSIVIITAIGTLFISDFSNEKFFDIPWWVIIIGILTFSFVSFLIDLYAARVKNYD